MKMKELLDEIVDLPVEMRARLADAILQSLNPIDREIEAAWIEEVHRRMKDVEEGRATLIPGEEVMKKARRIIESPDKKND